MIASFFATKKACNMMQGKIKDSKPVKFIGKGGQVKFYFENPEHMKNVDCVMGIYRYTNEKDCHSFLLKED